MEFNTSPRVRAYDLKPTLEQNQISFYGKAVVRIYDDGTKVLFSYDTPIMAKEPHKDFVRIWNDWSVTTGRHIKAFSGLNKRQFEALPLVESVGLDI